MVRLRDGAALLLGAAMILLLSPLRALWVGGPWWSAFAVWGLLVAAAGVLAATCGDS